MRRTLSLLAAAFVLAAAGQARADLLPLPEGLIALDSQQGEAILYGAEARRDYFPLSMYFVTQDNPAFCGPATISMVLNALGVARPKSDATAGFGIFDQKNIFTPKAEKVKAEKPVLDGGMTLDELGGILGAHGLSVELHHAADITLEKFRSQSSAVIADFHPLRSRQLSPQRDRAGDRRPHLAARRLRQGHRPLPHPRRVALQIPARLGDGVGALRRDEHARLRQQEPDARLSHRRAVRLMGEVYPVLPRRTPLWLRHRLAQASPREIGAKLLSARGEMK